MKIFLLRVKFWTGFVLVLIPLGVTYIIFRLLIPDFAENIMSAIKDEKINPSSSSKCSSCVNKNCRVITINCKFEPRYVHIKNLKIGDK